MSKTALAALSFLLIGATDGGSVQTTADAEPGRFDNPAYQETATPWDELPRMSGEADALCADRIHEAREQAGLPRIDRRPADANNPELIWAVDHRREGCGVLVAKGNLDDIRPVPESAPVEMLPADD